MRALSTAGALGGWLGRLDDLRINPVPPLLEANDPALTWAVRHDILGEPLDPRVLWDLPEPAAAVGLQTLDGGWRYPGGRTALRAQEDYDQLETFKQLLRLTSVYRWHRRYAPCAAAAEFLLDHQTAEGDIRGVYGLQYSTTYTALILAALIDAGYVADRRVTAGLDWLLSMQQDDGGWVVPLRTMRGATGRAYERAMRLEAPVQPDRRRRSSHLVTGVVVRALSAHPRYQRQEQTRRGIELLISRFFHRDPYPDRADGSYWTKLVFPFRWTDIVSSLDAIGRCGLDGSDPRVERAIAWLVDAQGADGLWRSGYPKTRDPLVHHWVTFAAARALLRLG